MKDNKELLFKAVSYLTKHRDDAPESVLLFIDELNEYEAIGNNINEATARTEETLEDLRSQGIKIMGSVDTIIKLMSKSLSEEELESYKKKFDDLKVKESEDEKNPS